MSSPSAKTRAAAPEFLFIGEHPAIDFANTLAVAQGEPADGFRDWADVLAWLSLAGLGTEAAGLVPASRRAQALLLVVKLREAWKAELERLVAGGKISGGFVELVNRLLEADVLHETLSRLGKTGFQLAHSKSKLTGDRLVLAILARQIARFLAEANLEYLHRCANRESCVLYFYDTTKNHRRQWCSVAVCGNRHKVAQYRRRQAGEAG